MTISENSFHDAIGAAQECIEIEISNAGSDSTSRIAKIALKAARAALIDVSPELWTKIDPTITNVIIEAMPEGRIRGVLVGMLFSA